MVESPCDHTVHCRATFYSTVGDFFRKFNNSIDENQFWTETWAESITPTEKKNETFFFLVEASYR